uniref:Odorant binding protein 3 n=1 Tax=Cyrtorhinus lividipennis TaxID=1032904 RepID=A0A1W6AWG2_9HEMI|nr:odorant binding protein 3 [Cyrtorhinus lividipennis]
MNRPLLLLTAVLAVGSGQEEDCKTAPAGWPRRPPQCCDVPFPLEGMKKEFGSCIRQIGNRQSSAVPTAQAVRDARLCIEECVYKGLGYMDEQNLKKDEVLEQLKKGVASKPEWTQPMEKAVNACYETITKREAPKDGACKDYAHEFTHCIMRQLFLSCPSSEWKNNDECNLVKSRMQVCPNIPPPPPPPPARFQGQGPPPQY